MLLLDLSDLHTNCYVSAPLYLFGNKPINVTLFSFSAILAILALFNKLFSGEGNPKSSSVDILISGASVSRRLWMTRLCVDIPENCLAFQTKFSRISTGKRPKSTAQGLMNIGTLILHKS